MVFGGREMILTAGGRSIIEACSHIALIKLLQLNLLGLPAWQCGSQQGVAGHGLQDHLQQKENQKVLSIFSSWPSTF